MRIIKNILILFFGLPFIIAIVMAAYRSSSGPKSPTVDSELQASATPTPEIEVLSYRGYERASGFYSVEGQVRNTTTEPIRSVFAVATWYGANGEFITTDDALIEYQPLMPSQTSPFQVLTNGNPLMKRFTVEFKTGNGRQLRHTERKK